MANQANLARPYARAAFEYATSQQQIKQWAKDLQTLAEIVRHKEISHLLKNPKFNAEQFIEIISALINNNLAQPKLNFIKQLAEKHRLLLLPEISQIFTEFCLQIESTIEVQIYSAIPLAEEFKKELNANLSTRFNKRTELHFHIDETLIGGLLIRAGDRVIDASVRGQLARMREALMS